LDAGAWHFLSIYQKRLCHPGREASIAVLAKILNVGLGSDQQLLQYRPFDQAQSAGEQHSIDGEGSGGTIDSLRELAHLSRKLTSKLQ